MEVAPATPDAVGRLGDAAWYRWVATWLSGVDVLQVCDLSGPARGLVESASSFACVVAHQGVADVVAGEFGGAVDVRCAQVDRLPFPHAGFGAIVCPAATVFTDPEPVLAELVRVLRPRGILVVSPGPARHADGAESEVTLLGDALRKQFGHVEELEQSDLFVSAFDVLPSDEHHAGRDAMTLEVGRSSLSSGRTALIASSARLTDLDLPAAVCAPMDLAQWRAAAAAQAEAAAELRDQLQGAAVYGDQDYLVRQLFLSEQTLALALDNANRWEVSAVRARSELDEARQRVAAMRRELTLAQEQVVALRASTSWRATEPLRQLKRIAGLLERT